MPVSFANKLSHLIQLSAVERQVLRSLPSHHRQVRAHRDIVADGDWPAELSLITDGFACRYKLLADGARQIMSVLIPGDVCDLCALLTGRMDHGVAAINNNQIATIPRQKIFDVIEQYPRIGQALWRDTMLDAALYRQWLINVGRRSAYQRVAHMLCEICARLEVIGRRHGNAYSLPMTQTDLGDALGLSLVHVNRTLKRLREDGLITFHNHVVVLDWQGLCGAADFDPSYLQLGPEQRVLPQTMRVNQ